MKKVKYSFVDCMIDIETLSTKNNAAICSISAVKFNPFTSELGDKKQWLIKWDSDDIKQKYNICDKTLAWWNQQDEKVKFHNLYNNENRVVISQALTELNEFLQGIWRYWSQGINFDFVILENAYHIENLHNKIRWKFYQLFDSRTISKLMKNTTIKKENNHDSLYDAIYQAQIVSEVINKLNIKSL